MRFAVRRDVIMEYVGGPLPAYTTHHSYTFPAAGRSHSDGSSLSVSRVLSHGLFLWLARSVVRHTRTALMEWGGLSQRFLRDPDFTVH